MYLKSLVLKGFKSFADRSVLTLEPGITAIVGPNGSGKSNISDAILWVLGERNAKSLRGQAMEDVIFSGSSARKPVSYAEVDLVLDNSDGTLPVDYHEVVITRRMYRSGESEYLLNGTVVRRMDVLDILHDTGLGTGTHSIISQGNLEAILQSKPEERRSIIEEAAGILKHKQRKMRSERKLANMDQHLLRVRDVVSEVERQLVPLERKAKRARTYQELKRELDAVTLQLAVDELRVLQDQWDSRKEGEAQLIDSIERRREEMSQIEGQVEALQERIRVESIDASALSRQHAGIAAAVERFDSTLLLIREKRRSALARVGELEVGLESNDAKRQSAESELEAALLQLGEVRAGHDDAVELRRKLEASYGDVQSRRRALEEKAGALTSTMRECEDRSDVMRRKHAETQEVLANGLAHIKVIEGHIAELEIQLSRSIFDAEKLAGQLKQDESSLLKAEEEEATARQHAGEMLRRRDAVRASSDEEREKVRDLSTRIGALEEVERANAAAEGPARAWVAENESSLRGSLEPLTHVVQVSSGLEVLVERLLGDDLKVLLVDDAESTRLISAQLDEEGRDGMVSFLLRDDIPSEPLAARYPMTAPGRPLLADLTYPPSAARAIDALLGDVVVCESLDESLRAHESDALGLRFVAFDGSVVWPSGKVSVGVALETDGEGVLARVRHLEELRVALAEAKDRSETLLSDLKRAEEDLRVAQTRSLDLSQALASMRGKHEALRAEADRGQEKLAAVRRELEGVQHQRTEAEHIIATARPDVERFEREQREIDEAYSQAKVDFDEVQQSLTPLRREAHKISDRIADAKLKVATLSERLVYVERIVEARRSEITLLDEQDRRSRDALEVKRISARRIDPLIAIFEELAAGSRIRMRGIEELASASQVSSSGLHAAASEARELARKARASYDVANEELAALRVEKGRLEIRVEAAVRVIVEDCQTPLESALELPPSQDRRALEDASEALRRRIRNLGSINPDAAQDYEELKVRYDFLMSQLSDLDAARRSLAKINRVIDARMREDFTRTLALVNDNFKEIFAVLFPGGSAELSLVDPDDPEGSGVEVTAQPAGKRITKMTLMSGGEKSLTALALLFAVYRTRSTPFYVLDEVEAALDDTNLRRLISYIEQLRDGTQLVMITHQRRTMEMADVLFGVSMQSDGVTKVISQRLEKALRYAE